MARDLQPPADAGAEPTATGRDLAPPPQPPSTGDAALISLHNGIAQQWGPQVWGAQEAVLGKLAGRGPEGESLGDAYRRNRDQYASLLASARAAHPTASAATDLAGSVGSAALLPQGRALKGAAALSKAALVGAGMGGVQALGASKADLSPLLDKFLTAGIDPVGFGMAAAEHAPELGQAAKDTAVGAGVGSVLGPAGELAGRAVSAVADPVSHFLRGLSRNRAINAVGPTAGQVKNTMAKGEADALGDWLVESGAVKAGRSMKTIDERLGKSILTDSDKLKDALAAADAAIAPKMSSGGLQWGADTADLAARFRVLRDEADRMGPGMANVAKKFDNAALAVDQRPESLLRPSEAVEWKRGYQEPVNYAKLNQTPLEQGSGELAKSAREWAKDAVHQAGPDVGAAYDAANAGLHNALTAATMTEGGTAREAARNILSPSSKFAGAAMASHGKSAGGSALLGAAGALANKFIQGRASSTLAVGARTASDKIAALASSAPASLGRFGPVLSAALARGQDEFNANVFTLAQTDPDFQALQQRLAEQK